MIEPRFLTQNEAQNLDVCKFCRVSRCANINLDHWDFYVLPTRVLDKNLPNQKSISLSGLEKLKPLKVKFNDLRNAVEKQSKKQ